MFKDETHSLEGFFWRGDFSGRGPVRFLEENSTDESPRKVAGLIYSSEGKWIAEVAERKTLPTENFMTIGYFEDEDEAKMAVEESYSRRL